MATHNGFIFGFKNNEGRERCEEVVGVGGEWETEETTEVDVEAEMAADGRERRKGGKGEEFDEVRGREEVREEELGRKENADD